MALQAQTLQKKPTNTQRMRKNLWDLAISLLRVQEKQRVKLSRNSWWTYVVWTEMCKKKMKGIINVKKMSLLQILSFFSLKI